MRCSSLHVAEINRILGHPAVWRHVHDDFVPAAARTCIGELLLGDTAVRVLMPARGVVLVARPFLNPLLLDLHVAALPEVRGEPTFAALRDGLHWLFDHTPAVRLLALVPACNRPALGLVRILGFRVEGELRRSYLKDGVLYDRRIYALDKENYHARR